MVTKHLLQELGHEIILMNHVDCQSAKAWASKRLGRMKRVMLKYVDKCELDMVKCLCTCVLWTANLEPT